MVVGDVTVDSVMALAKKYLEPIPRAGPPPPVRTKEPEQLGERRVTVKKPAQLPLQMIAYHVPDATHPDTKALDLIATILSIGQSSRLYKRMVDREQLVLDVGSAPPHSLNPSLFIFSISPRSGVDMARTESVLYEELANSAPTPASAEELRKAKNHWLAHHYQQLKTIAGRANLLGEYEVLDGDYRKAFTSDRDIDAVTAADVQRVAKKYFSPDNRTVATLIPETKQ